MCGFFKMCLCGRRRRKDRRDDTAAPVAPPAPEQEPQTASYVLVLIMVDCNEKTFNKFIAQLPKEGAKYNQRYEQSGINLRGYKTALEVDYARALRESQVGVDAGILGVAYYGGVLLNPPPSEQPTWVKPPGTAQPGHNVGLGDLWHLKAVDASPSHSAGRGVNVYVMDSGINEKHAEFQGRDFSEYLVAKDFQGNAHDLKDSNGHGTAVASLIGGNNVGVAKGVNIIPVRYLLPDHAVGLSTITKASPMSVFESLLWILWHVIKNDRQGRAVVNVSQGVLFNWTNGIDDPTEEEMNSSDPWLHFLGAFSQQDIVVVTSAGHSSEGTDDAARTMSPRRLACEGAVAERTLIVAGGSQRSADNPDELEFWPESNWYEIVNVLAPGKEITVARHNYDGVWKKDQGTSLSAAITSGIVAQYLGENDVRAFNPGEVARIVKKDVGQITIDADAGKGQVTHKGRVFPLLHAL